MMEILFQDEAIVVVNKPSGLLSVPGRGPEKIDSVSHRIRTQIPGCIEQFQNRETEKHYEALLEGELQEKSGTITLPFRLDVENRPYQIYDEIHGKMGITHWKNLGIEHGRTRIAFHPETGRTHQLRVHSAHPKGLGIPIVDDPLYGHGDDPGKMKLHAGELTFTHPVSGKRLTFSAPCPF